MIRAETKRSIDGLLTDNLPCPINKTIKTIGLKQDIYHREGRGGGGGFWRGSHGFRGEGRGDQSSLTEF